MMPSGDEPMSAPRPFRFGLGPAGLGAIRGADGWRELARQAEDLGYSTVCLGDHLDARPAPGHLALALALWTTELRTAVHVFGNDFRHPAIVAKEAATLAMLTDGRVDIGLGAGWLQSDYDHAGFAFDPPGARIDRLREAAAVLRSAWSEETAHHLGATYQVHDLPVSAALGDVAPPPLVMGGGGPKMLTLAAQQADIVSINVRLDAGRLSADRGRSGTEDATRDKVELIRTAAGERFSDLELQVELHHLEITDDAAGALERASTALGIAPDEAARSPHVLVGSPAQVVDRLVEVRARYGISYFCMRADARHEFAPVLAQLGSS